MNNNKSVIRIISYNLLSSKLSSPDQFTHTNPDHLDPKNHRLPLILQRLSQEIQNSSSNIPAIFCLQEVSREWSGPLQAFFANHNYQFITGLYGHQFNGYMGVALAYPMETFQVISVDIGRLSEEGRSWPVAPPPEDDEEGMVMRVGSWMMPFWKWIKSFPVQKMLLLPASSDSGTKTIEHWSYSERRHNVLITACLRHCESKRVFCVSTYHMPCAFYAPMVMTIHCEMSIKRCQDLAMVAASKEEREEEECVPYILAGDFNIETNSPQYRLMTTGSLHSEDDEDEETRLSKPTSKFGMEWESRIGEGMDSAYAISEHGEPKFTNYALTKDMEEPFMETLDYIFLSKKHWEVVGVKPLVQKEVDEIPKDKMGPYPNENEPSDHVLISADLKLLDEGKTTRRTTKL